MRKMDLTGFSMLLLQSLIISKILPSDCFIFPGLNRQNAISAKIKMKNVFRNYQRVLFGNIYDNDSLDDEDEECAGVIRVLSLPVESIKPGGLRLFLMLHLMGMQNTPQKGAWSVDQPTTEEYAVDLYFHDKSAMLMIRLTETEVLIDRMGSMPSTSYVMQEAIVVDSILKELELMTHEGDIKDEDRLILLKNQNSVEELRDDLSFG